MKNLKSNLASKIDRIFAITTIVLLMIYSVVLTYYTDTLQEQLYERDVLIEKLSKRDSILNEIFTINYDTLNNTTSYTYIERNGEVVKYDVLAKDLDSTRNQLLDKNEELAEVLYLSNDLQEELNVSQGKYDSLVYDYNKLVGNYNALGKNSYENAKYADSVFKVMKKSLDSLAVFKTFTEFVEKNYDFKFSLDNNNRTIQITNPKIDSALILFPYYKNRLSFDKSKNVWVIETDREK